MSARITRLCCLLTALFLFPFPAFGQAQEAPEPAPEAAGGAEEEPLSKREFEEWKKTAFEELKNQVAAPQTEMTAVEPMPAEPDDLEARVAQLEGSVDDLGKIAFDQNAKLGAIAKKVTQSDGDTWVPNINRAWENEQFRQDMSRAVHGSMDRQGTVWIHNKSAVGHTLLVNNSHYVYVGPGQDHRVEGLSVGTISTELVGYERPRNWSLGPPDYEQHINIVPNSPTRVVAERPVSESATLRTVYSPYSPPVYSTPVFVAPPVVVGPPVVVDPPIVWLW